MTVICGAWSLSGGPVGKYLDETAKKAISGRLGVPQDRLVSVQRGPLWLAAPAWSVLEDRSSLAAFAGLPSWAPPPPLRPPPGIPPYSGHYAFAFSDLENKTLLLRSDPGRAQVVYYRKTPELLFFSSSLGPLLAGGRIPLSPGPLMEALVTGGRVFGDETFFEGLLEVKPGQDVFVSGGEISIRPAWHPGFESPEPFRGDIYKAFRSAMLESTELALKGIKEAAVLLSAGADSACVAACAAEVLGKKNVHAFTYDYADPGRRGESSGASEICRRLGISHGIITITREDYLRALSEVIWYTGEFNVRVSAQSLVIAEAAKARGLTHLLSGVGMEQLLGKTYTRAQLETFGKLPAGLPLPAFLLRYWKLPWLNSRKIKDSIDAVLPVLSPCDYHLRYMLMAMLYHSGHTSRPWELFPAVLVPQIRELILSPRVVRAAEKFKSLPLSSRLVYHEIDFYLSSHALRPVHRMGLAKGVIFSAPALLKPAAALEKNLRWHTGGVRSRAHEIVVRAMKGMLPEDLVSGRKIAGLTDPDFPSWMAWAAALEAGSSEDSAAALARILPRALYSFFPVRMNMLTVWHRLCASGVNDVPTRFPLGK